MKCSAEDPPALHDALELLHKGQDAIECGCTVPTRLTVLPSLKNLSKAENC